MDILSDCFYNREYPLQFSNIFNELKKEVDLKNQKYYDKMELESILSEASKAWARKDFRKYFEVLTPYVDDSSLFYYTFLMNRVSRIFF